MTVILRRLPYYDHPSRVAVRGLRVRVKAHQIVVWASVSAPDVKTLEPNCPKFPVIVDTANTFTFSVRESQLRQWAGIHPDFLPRFGSVRHAGRSLPVYDATVWLHRNQPGERDRFLDQPPSGLKFSRGIAVYPNDMAQAPRLPLLGLRALMENRLHLLVDAEHGWVSLRMPDWRTRLARWLF